MKTIFLFAALIVITSCRATRTGYDPLDTADNFVLEKYVGKWYEIAALPNEFEVGCRCVQADYSLNTDGTIKVVNSCNNGTGTNFTSITGTAEVVEKPSKLEVKFPHSPKGRYWVLKIDDEHTYSLVGEPTRKYLWILSRQRTLDTEIYNDLVEHAKSAGFPVDKLEKTVQDCE